MAADVHVGDGLLNGGHVARHAFAARRASLVTRVGLNGRRVRTIGRLRTMAGPAEHVCRLEQIGVVRRAVDVVTGRAGHTVRVHGALDIVVALHAILVAGAIGIVRECGCAKLWFFQLPEIF